MFRSLGMKVDVQRRRLWVVSHNDWSDSMMSAVHIYDIDTKRLIKKFITKKDPIPSFNDLVITNSGTAYITDTRGNSTYYLPSDLSKVELFLISDSLLASANCISISSDNSLFYVASYKKGIAVIDLNIKSIQPIIGSTAIDTRGIDGLMLYNNNLIGIYNGDSNFSKHRIVRYQLSNDGHEITSESIIDQNNPLLNEPTTGVIIGDELYCLAATYLHLLELNGTSDTTKLKNPIVLVYNLSKKINN